MVVGMPNIKGGEGVVMTNIKGGVVMMIMMMTNINMRGRQQVITC